MIQMNGVDIEGLADTGVHLSIPSQGSWNPGWPLQKVYTQFIEIGKLSCVRQSKDGFLERAQNSKRGS